MTVKWLTIQSGITMAHQNAFVEFNQHHPKKSRTFANTHAYQKKISLLKYRAAIKNAGAGSTEQEKDVQIYDFTPYSKIRGCGRFETAPRNNIYLYRRNNLISSRKK